MKSHVLQIEPGSCGEHAPYIYCIYSVEHNCVYIGQTFSRQGFLGRLAQHLSLTPSATFRSKVSDIYNICFSEVMTFGVRAIAITLPDNRSYHIQDYREAVEFLVQYGLIKNITDQNFKTTVVSRTRNNGYAKLKYIQNDAESISRVFCLWLRNLNLGPG